MQTRLIDRAVSLCLAATVTLALVAGIGHLAQPDATSAIWAQSGSTRA